MREREGFFFSSGGGERHGPSDTASDLESTKKSSCPSSAPSLSPHSNFFFSSSYSIARTLNARWLSASALYKWSLRRCSRAATAAGEGEGDDALALPPLAVEDSLKKGSLSGSTARHDWAAAVVEGWAQSVVMAGRRAIELAVRWVGEKKSGDARSGEGKNVEKYSPSLVKKKKRATLRACSSSASSTSFPPLSSVSLSSLSLSPSLPLSPMIRGSIPLDLR